MFTGPPPGGSAELWVGVGEASGAAQLTTAATRPLAGLTWAEAPLHRRPSGAKRRSLLGDPQVMPSFFPPELSRRAPAWKMPAVDRIPRLLSASVSVNDRITGVQPHK